MAAIARAASHTVEKSAQQLQSEEQRQHQQHQQKRQQIRE